MAGLLLLVGCTADPDGPVLTPAPSRTAGPSSTGAGPTGESSADGRSDAEFERDLRRLLVLPDVPAFTVPTQSLTAAAAQDVSAALDVAPGLYEGIGVLDARCTDAGAAAADTTTRTPGAGASVHHEDGELDVTVSADGTGVYEAPGLRVAVLPDGAGVYDDGTTRVSVAVDGSGTYRDGERRYTVRADGTGSYEDATTRVWVDADGAGGYDDGTTRVSFGADGVFGGADPGRAAAVRAVLADGLPRFEPVPRVAAIEPAGTVCGTVIRLDADVLFDFGSADVRPEGQETLGRVAALLVALGGPAAAVEGHTDGVGDEAANQDLSERRAAAVRDLLVAGGAPADRLTTRGWGETRPARPETTPDGADDPGARQLNRRVELVLLDG
ncbi:OmpA family protein [Cellulomonas endophytica]|uniref:OmpA family protein n=1 Tax=Cellulomonas endophytica TaxID=2494735 RepID=UPI0013E983EB|nr:OmpA family protein [Cellulomonas endophytica]